MSTDTKQKQDSSQSTSPWAPQIPYLQQAFGGASNALNSANSNFSTPSEFTAGLTPDQVSTFQRMVGYGLGNNPIPGAETNAATSALGAGTSGVNGALSTLNGFNPAATNNTGAVLSAANQFADNPAIPGMVQAAMRDATQQARDVTLPGMEANAAGTGNINSSRTGVSEGILQRGLAQQAGDISAQLRGTAFNNGVTNATNMLGANNNATLGAATAAGAVGNGALNAGIGAGSGAIANQGNLFNMAATGGAGQQAGNQATDTNALQGAQYSQTAPFTALQNFLQLVGGSYGGNSTGTQTQTTTPSMFSTIGSLLGAGGSAVTGVPGFSTGLSALKGLFV